MQRSIFKPILAGILFGAFVFFTGPLILIVLLLKFIFTPFGMGRWRMSYWGGPRPWGYAFAGAGPNGQGFGFADRIRSMSDEEYGQFKSKMQDRFPGCGWHGRSEPQGPASEHDQKPA
jgi:hypothetical protein